MREKNQMSKMVDEFGRNREVGRGSIGGQRVFRKTDTISELYGQFYSIINPTRSSKTLWEAQLVFYLIL